jgi:hypothetical protein
MDGSGIGAGIYRMSALLCWNRWLRGMMSPASSRVIGFADLMVPESFKSHASCVIVLSGVRSSNFKASAYIPLLSNLPVGLPAFLAALRAVESAIAIACFCGLPDFISLLILELIVFWL